MQCGYTEVNPGPKYSSLTFCDWNLSSLTAHDTKVHVPQYNEISLFNDPLWNIFRSYIPNHMHVNKVGHASEFPFNIYWWTLKNPKNQNEKNCWKCRHFIHVYQKQQSYEVQFLIYRVRPFFLVILGHFLPFTPKQASGDVILLILHLCTTNDDHDVWFLRYQARQDFFVILGYFLPFYSPFP